MVNSYARIQKGGGGRGSDNVFIVINVFLRGPYGPSLKSNWTQIASRGVRNRILRKPIATWRSSSYKIDQ